MPAEKILAEVIFAMQAAEEIGGPEGSDYLDLMESIANEASKRRWTYRAVVEASEARKLAARLLDLAEQRDRLLK